MYVCMYVCMYIYIYLHIYICMYVCVYIYVYIYLYCLCLCCHVVYEFLYFAKFSMNYILCSNGNFQIQLRFYLSLWNSFYPMKFHIPANILNLTT